MINNRGDYYFMEKYFIFMIMLSSLLLFGCSYHKNTEKDDSYDKTSDNSISIPPILSDDNLALETSSLNRAAMFEITHMVSQNTMTGVGGSYSIQNINAIAPIKQIRKCINTDEFYNVYEMGKGRFYVFYVDGYSTPYQVWFYCYAEKRLLFSDFDNIEKGKATIDDVRKIDEATEYNANGGFGPQGVVNGVLDSYENYSLHMTKEGVVSIGYKSIDGKLYVDYIKKHNEKRMSEINTLDLP